MRINSTNAASAGQGIANQQQRQQGFKNLMSAVQSGDMATAQQAYADLTKGKSAVDPSSPLGQLGAALQSGDVDATQKVAQSIQASRSGHAHHHHGGASATTASTASSGATTSTASATAAMIASAAPSRPGSLINLVA
jgi:hypothetical protein